MEPVARGARHGRPPLRESRPTKGGAEPAGGGWSRPTGTAGGWASRGRGAPPEAGTLAPAGADGRAGLLHLFPCKRHDRPSRVLAVSLKEGSSALQNPPPVESGLE